jgi:hypothetical protein
MIYIIIIISLIPAILATINFIKERIEYRRNLENFIYGKKEKRHF